MKAKRLLFLLPVVASLGVAFSFTSKEARKADALIETKLVVRNGDEYEMNYNLETSEYFVEGIDLYNGQEVYVLYGIDTYGFSELDPDSYQYCFEGEENYIGISNDSTFCFYFSIDEDNASIRVTIDSSLEAETWADNFLDNIACDPEYLTPPTNWYDFADDFQASLSDGAKDLFIDAVASKEQYATSIQKAAYVHDLCVQKYSSEFGLPVFMYREGGGSRAIYIDKVVPSHEFNSSALIITIISVVGATSLLALLIFKKKQR